MVTVIVIALASLLLLMLAAATIYKYASLAIYCFNV